MNKVVLNKKWFLVGEHDNSPPLFLHNFFKTRCKNIKTKSGKFLNSFFIYKNGLALTGFDRNSFNFNKRYFFNLLKTNPAYFELLYKQEEVLINQWQKSTTALEKKIKPRTLTASIKDLQIIREAEALMQKIAFLGQPINMVEFDEPVFSNYLRNYLSKIYGKVEANDVFVKLTSRHIKAFPSVIDTKHARLFALARNMIVSKNNRYKVWRKHISVLKKLTIYFSRITGISSPYLLSLGFNDFITAIQGRSLPSSVKFGVIFNELEEYNLTSSERDVLFNTVQPLVNKNASVVTGQPVMPGLVKGKVAIVKTTKDFVKVKKGTVLVVHTTNANMMTVIKKAGAIVADMGGLTSHPAIVSRELKIPSIIDTKIGTKVLKDGDVVEVDANKGVVKKLNK